MKLIPQSIPDVILVQPEIHGDSRGYFVETFRQDEFEKAIGQKISFVQDSESKSSRGVLRGLHFQLPPFAQSKLVRVIKGSILDVAVDLHLSSPSYGHYVKAVISSDQWNQILVPIGFAHGFCTLEDNTEVIYKVSNLYSPNHDKGVRWNDPKLKIDWPVSADQVILSQKDMEQPFFDELPTYFE